MLQKGDDFGMIFAESNYYLKNQTIVNYFYFNCKITGERI
jgi:hypothetical protein